MDISSTTSTSSTISSGTSTTATASAISSDFETFLKMLTAQMQNQDPLNPVDSTDYATQLATFSSVEQQVLSNDLLLGISTALHTGGLSELSGWVGMDALTTAPAYFSGSSISVRPEIPDGASKAELVVSDEFGAEVDREDVLGKAGAIDWAGTDASGTTLPHGTYTFELIAISADGTTQTTPVSSYRRIVEARAGESGVILGLEGGYDVFSDEISALRQDY